MVRTSLFDLSGGLEKAQCQDWPSEGQKPGWSITQDPPLVKGLNDFNMCRVFRIVLGIKEVANKNR